LKQTGFFWFEEQLPENRVSLTVWQRHLASSIGPGAVPGARPLRNHQVKRLPLGITHPETARSFGIRRSP
jgi:hypothetical protein